MYVVKRFANYKLATLHAKGYVHGQLLCGNLVY